MFKKILLSSLISSAFAVTTLYADTMTNASSAGISNSSSPNFYADKWYRDSAERNAIYREVYFLALQKIQQEVSAQHLTPHQWGIVMDIDETVLDNSAWDKAHDLYGDSQNWGAFAAKAVSVPTPGVKSFINQIHAMGGYVNLVSNRPNTLLAATIKNLKAQGIYFDQVLLDTTNAGTSFVDKNPRFQAIMNGASPSKFPKQKIVAWFGDNIQDFPDLLQADMIKQNPNAQAYGSFGVTDFVLPNPMYGSWEKNDFN